MVSVFLFVMDTRVHSRGRVFGSGFVSLCLVGLTRARITLIDIYLGKSILAIFIAN